ncbi:hypothetical protein AMTRI_Chr11g94640 [Amborella trichopoda]
MEKFQKTQLARLVAIASLFIVTPLIRPWMRPTYLYFLLNLLILSLGLESGALASLAKPNNEKKPTMLNNFSSNGNGGNIVATLVRESDSGGGGGEKLTAIVRERNAFVGGGDKVTTFVRKRNAFVGGGDKVTTFRNDGGDDFGKVTTIVKEESHTGSSVVLAASQGMVSRVRKDMKSPSTPSLFYIEGEEEDAEAKEDVSSQELFAKVENFIGNFYEQLKMQR